jgi:hypothetical protein
MKSYKRNPFEQFDMICVTGLTERFKKKYMGKNEQGKAMYETTDVKEIVLSQWAKEEL